MSQLITREPELQERQTKRFTQELVLEPGNYALRFRYDQEQERVRGRAIDRDYDSFNGLQIDGAIDGGASCQGRRSPQAA